MDLLIKAMARDEPILVVSLDDTNTVLYHCPCSKERVLDAIVSLTIPFYTFLSYRASSKILISLKRLRLFGRPFLP